MKYMKKTVAILLTLFLILQCNIVAFAADAADIWADKVSLSQTEPTLIPIKIDSNNGIMGFKITVEYPVDKLDIKSVSRGEITAKGNFNTNLGINDGRFDVLWNNTEDVTENGTLFVISALAKNELSKDTEIKLSFSQPDTFNEKYEDVAFNCKNIIISTEKIETTTVETHQNEESTTKAPSPIDSSQVLDAVKITLEQSGYKSLSDVTDKEKFVREFNKNLEIITGSNEHNVSNFESLVSLYEGKFITDATNNIEQNDIQTAINEALKSVNALSIEEIKDKDKEKFVKNIEEKLKEQNPDTPNISEELETDKALDIIKKLYNSTNVEESKQQNNENNNSNKAIIIVAVSVGLVTLLISVVIIFKKKKLSKR